MACRTCSSSIPSTPYTRSGLPTVWAWGPFADHEEASEQQVLDFLASPDGTLQPQA